MFRRRGRRCRLAPPNRCLPPAYATPFPQKRTTSRATADSSWWTHHGEHGAGGAGHQLGHRVEEMSSHPELTIWAENLYLAGRRDPLLYDRQTRSYSPIAGRG